MANQAREDHGAELCRVLDHEQIVFPHYMQWSMYAVAIKQGAFLTMTAITSLSAKRDSHDISVKTPNTYSSQLTALPICKFLHVRGPAAGAKPYNIQNTLPDKHPNTSPMHDCVSRWRHLPKRHVSTVFSLMLMLFVIFSIPSAEFID